MFFSIRTIRSSGLGDQLGTQFMRLYKLGKSLEYDFIWNEMFFPRSVKPQWYENEEKRDFAIRYYLIKFLGGGKNIFASGINALLLRRERKLFNKLLACQDDLASFLYLDSLSTTNRKCAFVDIALDEFIESRPNFTKEEISEFIIYKSNGKTPRLVWTSRMWSLIPQIDRYLEQVDMLDLDNGILADKMFSCNNSEPSCIFHIRCGDSTTIHLPNTDLIVYDKYLFTKEEELLDIYKIDSHRRSILPEEYLSAYFNEKTKSSNITIISDGYDLTFRNIFKNLLKRRCPVHLCKEDREVLLKKARDRNKIFDRFEGANLLIGESEQLLKESILKISNADTIIWGIGGFALTIHKIFGTNRNCIFKNIRELE